MKRLALFVAFGFMALVFNCCKNNKPVEETPDAGFVKYISAYTSGAVSVESAIEVRLANPFEKEITVGAELSNNLFSFEPSLKGKTVWLDKSTIQFVPAAPMEGGAFYKARFKLAEVTKTGQGFEVFPFSFSTIKQSFGVTSEGLKTYPGNDFSLMFFKGYVVTADVIASEELEKVVSVEYNSRSMDLKWVHESEGLRHYFTIDSLKRDEKDAGKLKISWNGKSIGVDNKGSEDFMMPSLNDFRVMEAGVAHDPQLCVEVTFSDPLNKMQNLEGLVTIEDYPDVRFSVDGNRLKIWPGQEITGQRKVSVRRGVENALGYPLKEDQDFYLVFENMKPEVRLIGKGVIVPQQGQLSMPFEAVSLNAVDLRIIQVYASNVFRFLQDNDFDGGENLKKSGRLIYAGKVELKPDVKEKLYKWNTYKINIADYATLEQGAFYRIELRFRKAYSLYECGDSEETGPALTEAEEKYEFEQEQKEWDSPGWYSNYYYPPNFDWKERDNPCYDSYFYTERFVERNIFASSLGITAKEGKGYNLTFVVTNLNTVQPESKVNLKIYDYQGMLMQELSTDGDGLAKVDLKKKPFLLVAQKGAQTGYLRLDDGSALSLSNFDVSGQEVSEGLKGFIYGERGVWRPGDMMYLTFILEDKLKQLPENNPVIFKLTNPLGQVVERKVATSGENGFYHFAVKTADDAVTGNWEVTFQVGGTYFTRRVKVETIKPNRLKIDLKLPEVIDAKASQPFALQSAWLFGMPANSLATTIDLNLVKKNTTFKGYEKFSFDDPASSFFPVQKEFFKGRLDEKGLAQIPSGFGEIESAPGMLKAYFTTRVFEEGGDFSINVQSADVSPYKKYLGIKMPDSEDNWYKTDVDYQPEVVVVDLNGRSSSVKSAEAELYKIDWRWWWESGEDYLARYVNGRYQQPVAKWKLDNIQGRTKLNLRVKYKSWQDNGRYLLRIKDPETGQAAGLTFYMSKWGGWRSDDMENGATILSVRTDKEKYQVGEKIKVTIPSSKKGRALVSVESGEAVKDIFWVETGENATSFEVPAKPEMAPNVYIYVSLIQTYGQTENDAPLRLYGIAPVLVEDPATILRPVIKVKDELEPETSYEISVSEENGREMTYTLAVVDEGLTSLTNFKTPDPHQAMYAREALGVKTWDMYDYVAGAYGAQLEKAFAVGGDESLNNDAKKKVNRFKPVVEFAGPFTLKKGERKTHDFKMPNYLGAVRVMVVAGNKGAYGNAEKEVKVKKGLMVLPTLPRVLGPGESFSLPVSVFAMKDNVKDVSVSVQADPIFIVEKGNVSLHFSEVGEQMATLQLSIKEQIGSGKIKVVATSGSERAEAEIEIEIRNPNPPVTVEENGLVEGGKEWKATLTAPGMAGTNQMWLELSGLPPMNLSKYLEELIHYPHGCIEQTVSAAFPQLFLDKLTGLDADQKLRVEANIRQALQRLLSFQLPDGGFSYWPGGREVSEWGSIYAGHFMVLTEQKGYTLPIGLKNKWQRYQQNAARKWEPATVRNGIVYRSSELEQAYRLYTLALSGSPDLGSMNRLRETVSTPAAKWRLGAAYLLAGQPNALTQLINPLNREVEKYTEPGSTFGSDLRDQAMILETLVLWKDTKNAFIVLKEISDQINKLDWLSTQTAAWCFYAASLYVEKNPSSPEMNLKVSLNGKQENIKTSVPVLRLPVPEKSNVTVAELKNNGTQPIFARLVGRGTPIKGDTIARSNHLAMDVWFTDKSGKPVDCASLTQGDDIVMNVKVAHPGMRENYENLALTAVIPSGWEILNQRLNDVPTGDNVSFQYQDIRDDRVYTYFGLPNAGVKTYKFRLTVAYEGKFYLPAVVCEAMYDNSIYASVPGRWVVVKKR